MLGPCLEIRSLGRRCGPSEHDVLVRPVRVSTIFLWERVRLERISVQLCDLIKGSYRVLGFFSFLTVDNEGHNRDVHRHWHAVHNHHAPKLDAVLGTTRLKRCQQTLRKHSNYFRGWIYAAELSACRHRRHQRLQKCSSLTENRGSAIKNEGDGSENGRRGRVKGGFGRVKGGFRRNQENRWGCREVERGFEEGKRVFRGSQRRFQEGEMGCERERGAPEKVKGGFKRVNGVFKREKGGLRRRERGAYRRPRDV